MSPKHPILKKVEKKYGILFGHLYESTHRIFAATFAYLRAQGQLDSWRAFCQDFNRQKLEEVATFFKSIKFNSGDDQFDHHYGEIREGRPGLYLSALYYTEEVLAEVRRLSQLTEFPLLNPVQSIPVEAMRMADQRFPSTMGEEVARTEESWQRVHTFIYGKAQLFVTSAPNEKLISWLKDNKQISTLVALCPLKAHSPGRFKLTRASDADSCPDYRDVLGDMRLAHRPMPDNTFCLIKPEGGNTCFDLIEEGACFIGKLCEQLSAGEHMAVHCVSGVGRAGSFNLLLKAMHDEKFHATLINVTCANDIDRELLIPLAERLGQLLAEIRQVRYSVQSDSQFLEVLMQAILFKLVQGKILTAANAVEFVEVLITQGIGGDFLMDMFSQAKDFPDLLTAGTASDDDIHVLSCDLTQEYRLGM
jgi:hypothetical protein